MSRPDAPTDWEFSEAWEESFRLDNGGAKEFFEKDIPRA